MWFDINHKEHLLFKAAAEELQIKLQMTNIVKCSFLIWDVYVSAVPVLSDFTFVEQVWATEEASRADPWFLSFTLSPDSTVSLSGLCVGQD